MGNRTKRYSNIGNRIRELRIKCNLTQKQLSEKVNKSESSVRMWELGYSEPDIDTLDILSNIFFVSIDYLLGKEQKEMNFWSTFLDLCNKVEKSPNGVAKEIGISSAAITAWKCNRERVPQDRLLKKIADYFGVSIDYLKGIEQTAKIEKNPDEIKLTEGEKIMIDLIRKVPVEQQRQYILESALSQAEKALLELFRRVPVDKQSLVLGMIEAALKSL